MFSKTQMKYKLYFVKLINIKRINQMCVMVEIANESSAVATMSSWVLVNMLFVDALTECARIQEIKWKEC